MLRGNAHGFSISKPILAAGGLIIDGIEYGADALVAVARSPSRTSSCPVCGRVSAQIHSRFRLLRNKGMRAVLRSARASSLRLRRGTIVAVRRRACSVSTQIGTGHAIIGGDAAGE